ncbi:MAG: flagellar biosynthetic protein FliR [Acetatifactor sp.]|nr:flagellar biosynthetic protein FliR [Acetatifactor sp.]
MINYSFSIYDLEYFLLILTRVSCFVFIAPFFSMRNTPRNVRIVLSFFTSILLYQTLTPAPIVEYSTVLEYAIIIIKEAVSGLLLGFGATACSSIVNFAGSVADMEIGLSMVNLMDPATRQNSSITGVLYQYALMMMLVATGMYRYLFGALADSFTLIPVNGAVFNGESLANSVVRFLTEYVIIGFRIVLPVFCVMILLNAILGILAKVAPQMNMFAVGMQLKVLVGLSVIFFITSMLPSAADLIFTEMRELIVAFVEGMR